MTLDDALSCGRIIKVVVKEGFSSYEEASSGLDVRYGVNVRFKNLNGSAKSDVGILLENVKREQSWRLETSERDSGDVGLKLRWHGLNSANTPETQDVLEFTTRESLTGFSAVFDRKAKIERGRVLDYIAVADKDNIVPLTVDEADAITLYLSPKKFKDPKKPNEELIGIFHDGVDSVLSNEEGTGISSNAILAALVRSVQDMKVLISQLYARRVFEYSYVSEVTLAIVTKIGLGNETMEGTESTSYVITRVKSTLEGIETSELVTDISTVGTVQVVTENTENTEIVTYSLQ